MTEAQWLTCTNPEPMLSFLNERDASARKFRLFACACARRLWSVMADDHARSIVVDAERFADGLLPERERRERAEGFRRTYPPRMTPDWPVPPPYLAGMVAYYTIWSKSVPNPSRTLHLNEHGASSVSGWVVFTLVFQKTEDWGAWPGSNHPIGQAEADTHCRLLRDVFGNPFRPVCVDGCSLTPAAAALAQTAYAERVLPEGTLDPACLAVLADALEEAGCTDPAILGHLRGPGPHVRGCWVVDLILGRG
jgi:hypothetical protein